MPEVKAVDSSVNLAANSTGAILLLNGIVPGTALDERVGRQVLMTKLKLDLRMSVTAATGVDQVHRFLVVLDKQTNGAALAVTDVLNTVNPYSQVNLSNQARFTILLDRVQYLNASGEAGSGAVFRGSIGVHEVVQYNSGVAGTVADISTNSLYLISVGQEAAGATAGLLYGTARLRYKDE